MTDFVYRALFPPHYNPRLEGDTNENDQRTWYALRLPFIRVMGPMWSFGLKVRALQDVQGLPGLSGKTAVARSLRTLFQEAATHKHGRMEKFHEPVLLRTDVESFLPAEHEPAHESRLSLLAVDTIAANHITGGELNTVHPDDLPVVDGGGMIGGPTSIVVGPFGDPPVPIAKASAPIGYTQYLPAMQLMHGLIRFKPSPAYLGKVRKQLGLGPLPGGADPDMPNADTIVLLPDGFCVTGTISLPWRTLPVRGWFKATFRRYDTNDVFKPASGTALDAERLPERVLTPWFDPDSNGALETEWQGYLNAFERMLRESDEKKHGPKWLQIAPNTDMQPMHLFWPELPNSAPLFKRPASPVDAVSIDSAGLVARLSDRPLATGPLATLTIQPARFVVSRQQTDGHPEIVITGKAGHPATASGVDAIYQFGPSGKEGLSFAVAGKPDAPITLAVPLIETAEAVRRACGLEQPEPGALGLLWAFTPLNDGWLHWPLPNATPATLSIAVDNSVPAPLPTLRPAAPDDVNGALMFGNRMTSFAASNQRPWSFGVTDVLGADLSITFDAQTASFGTVKSARVVLSDVMLSLESFARVTAFRQTAERILPDHAERALNTFGLRAFSVESLRGIERRMWHQAGIKKAKSKIRMEAVLSGFRIDNSATDGARPADGAQVALKTMLGGRIDGAEAWSNDIRPWIWSHHDTLPTVQTLPLAVAGKLRNTPSGVRALAPLRLQDPPTNGELVYSGPLDLGAGAMDLAVGYTELVGGKPKPAQFARPNAGEAWRDEIGMSVTTLPSVTLFAGLKPRSAEIYASASWSGLSTSVRGEWRHDLALRDEHHAFARTPAAPPKGVAAPEEAPPPDVTFTPLPNNGPSHRQGAEFSNGWERVWQFVNRKAALAALDGRAMLERPAEGIRLVGVFGDTDFKIKTVVLSTDTVLSLTPPPDADPDFQQEVRSIGHYVFEPSDSAAKDAKKEFPGLPAEDDLTGLAGLFVRSGAAVKVTFGTAALRRDSGGFIDQHGLRLTASTAHAAVTVKQLVSPSKDLKTVRLVSLNAPISVANGNGPKLAFWCADVPVAEQKDVLGTFSATGDLEGRVNAAGRTSNHLAGFRWTLTSDGTPDGLVIVQGLVFEPVELVGFAQAGSDRPSEIRIRGRIRMPVSVKKDVLPVAEGVAVLTLTPPNGAGPYQATLASDELALPLANPESFSGIAPTLTLKLLPALNADQNAVLRYRLDDQDITVVVTVRRGADGTITMPNPLAGSGTTAKDPGAIDFSQLTLDLAGAVVSGNGVVLARPHAAVVSYDIRLGTPGAAITGKARVDLICRTITTDELKFRFSTADEIKIEPLKDTGLIFRSGVLALCWTKQTDTTRLLGGLSVTGAAGSALAALAGPIADGKVPPSYRVTDLDMRARLQLETFAPSHDGTIAAAQLVLTLDRVSQNRAAAYAEQIGYRIAGRIALRNAFSWPRLTIVEAPHHWLTATASTAAGDRFVHSAEVIFDGQRIMPRDLAEGTALALAAEVHHRVSIVTPTGGPIAGDKSHVTWRTYQAVKLFSMAALQVHLSAIATPVSGKIERAETALSPLMDKAATPLIDEKAAPHIHHIGSANPGTLSRKLAAQLLQHLKADPPPALMLDFSNHVLLAFDADNAGAAKLGAKLLLLGLPGVAFLGATKGTTVVPSAGPIAAAFASTPATETALHLSSADGYASLAFPALEPRLAERVRDRVANLAALRQTQAVDLPTLVTGFDPAPASQPVFQPAVFQSVAGGKATMAADDLPAVGSAFHLSQMFATLTESNPLAIGFGGRRLTAAEFFTEDLDDPKHPLKKPTVFDPTVYRRAIALFRNWAEQNVVPGPDILPQTSAADPLTRVVTVQVDGLSRDGQRVETIGRRDIVLRKDEALPTPEQALGWAKRTLQCVAPWAPRGLVTVRAVAFGLDDSSLVRPVEVTDTAPARVQRTVRLFDRALPQQAQRELARPMDAPSADIMPGYLPLDVAPALFQSDGEPLLAGTTDGPRLTATGVVMSWTMANGAHAVLAPAGSGAADDFWITDRETVAFRPFKKPPTPPTGEPYELTFALPDRYTAALPQALAPAAHGNEPANNAAALGQAFAPAYVGTSRISARAGAWTATRTGLIHARHAPSGSTSLRASETPVHVRQPRPPLLAVNDRPRASSHEEPHVTVGTIQTAVVHGPRAARIGSDPEPTGLNRAPRSLWATKLALVAPEASVLSREWDGTIQLDVIDLFGTLPGDGWTVAGAALVAEGIRYEAPLPTTPIPQQIGTKLSFEDFRDSKGTPARSAIRAFPGATEVTLELNLEFAQTGGNDTDVILNRQIRFRLLTAGAALSKVERPVFFRFDDPEFNDMLGGVAKLSRKPSAPWPADDVAFAADASEMAPEQRLELALALRPSVPGAKIETPFVSKALGPKGETILTYEEGGHAKLLRLCMERLRKDDNGGLPRPLTAPEGAVSNTVAAGGVDKGFFLKVAADGIRTTFHAMRIDCARLLSPTSQESAALQPGDQFRLDIVAGEDGELVDNEGKRKAPLISLLVDVVKVPNLPANPAAFAVLTMLNAETGSAVTVNTQVYANGPEAAVIEIVDPRDLIEGLVRRRAIYLWRSFHASRLRPRFALQKISGVGATWLPKNLARGWQKSD